MRSPLACPRRSPHAAALLVGLSVLGLIGCEGRGATGESNVAEIGEPRGICPMHAKVGGFSLMMEDEYSSLNGAVADGVIPISVLEEVASAGNCLLLRKRLLSCDPPCLSGEVCGEGDECVDFPRNLDVGTVTVKGLDNSVEMTATKVGKKYFDSNLTHPAFEEGDPLSLTASGGKAGGFQLFGVGMSPIELPVWPWRVLEGKPIEIEWIPAGDERASIMVTVKVDQHGVSPACIICEGPDNGTIVVPAELNTQLLQLGVSGFPNGSIYRRTVDSVDLDHGCVEFVVGSHHSVQVEI